MQPYTVITRYSAGILLGLAICFPYRVALSAQPVVHPGILVSKEQLDFVKSHATQEPWKSAMRQAKESEWGTNDTYKPTPWEEVECGSNSKPDFGCSDEDRDAAAAYTQALLAIYTADSKHFLNWTSILLTWAATLSRGHTNSNGPLQASWNAILFSRAQELFRYYDTPSLKETDQAGVTSKLRTDAEEVVPKMLITQFRPDILQMFEGGRNCYNKNWQASGIEALMNIGIVTDNRQWMDEAHTLWKQLLPAYIYLESDGSRPKDAPWCPRTPSQVKEHWHNPTAYIDGLTQETCRDLSHASMGLASLVNVDMTARIQGYPDFAEATSRIPKAVELQSYYANNIKTETPCGALLNPRWATFEIAYNYYANHLGIPMPETKAYLERTRPSPGIFHLRWETLTHGMIDASAGSLP